MAVAIILPCFLILLSFGNSQAQIPPNISLGSTITAGDNTSWLSLSGDFAFGFYRLSTGPYLLGVWLDKIPEKTLVWSANRNKPAENGSTIRLTFTGLLVLTYSDGTVQFVYSGVAAALGFMQNDGNFILKDLNSKIVWESFDSPTDTLLPGQVLVGPQAIYSNSKGNEDYSTGNFMLQTQQDGNLVLSAYHFSDPGYWYTTDHVVSNVSLVFNQTSALMYLVNGTGDNIHSLTKSMIEPVEDYYHRATIDDGGNFQQYIYSKKNGSSWRMVWRAITDPCSVNGACGVNGFCSSPDNDTISCNCLPGFIPLDQSNPSKGCHPEIVLNYCADRLMRNFTVVVIDDADFPYEGFADLSRVRNVDVEGCKKALMEDCYSMAAALVGSTCSQKRMPLLNARKSTSTKGSKGLVKVPVKIDDPHAREDKKKHFVTRGFLETSVLVSATLAFLLAVTAFYYHPATRRLVRRKRFSNSSALEINFREFTLQELREATDGFSKTLGRGSSGKVYHGTLVLKDKQIEIAVKRLEKVIERGEMEFMTELKIIGRTHHKNLVKLLGFCTENDQRILVYELMKNGSLSDLLFKEGEKTSWFSRAEMALGVARGLLYLHEECETQIIHCDIKPQNVLVDSNYTAKITDFGLSKILMKDQTRTMTGVRGTMGYMAPEWLRNAPVTSKVDIYSFGVMLLEIICGRRHIELSRVEEEIESDDLVLSDWVISCMVAGKLETVARHDPDVSSDFKRFERMAMVALWCIHPDPILRPSMKKVTQMLEGTMEVGLPPLLYDQMLNDQ